MDLQECFDGIDIYLFDLLLRGRITDKMRLLDAGCGGGRNLVYMLQAGFDVSAVDSSGRGYSETEIVGDETGSSTAH